MYSPIQKKNSFLQTGKEKSINAMGLIRGEKEWLPRTEPVELGEKRLLFYAKQSKKKKVVQGVFDYV